MRAESLRMALTGVNSLNIKSDKDYLAIIAGALIEILERIERDNVWPEELPNG